MVTTYQFHGLHQRRAGDLHPYAIRKKLTVLFDAVNHDLIGRYCKDNQEKVKVKGKVKKVTFVNRL